MSRSPLRRPSTPRRNLKHFLFDFSLTFFTPPHLAMAAKDEQKPIEETLDAKEEEEEQGGLDDDDEFLTLKSGGQQPESFEISRKCAELSKFVTTILEGDADATSIEIRQVPPETLKHVIDYLKHP